MDELDELFSNKDNRSLEKRNRQYTEFIIRQNDLMLQLLGKVVTNLQLLNNNGIKLKEVKIDGQKGNKKETPSGKKRKRKSSS